MALWRVEPVSELAQFHLVLQPQKSPRLPKLVRFLAVNALIGVAVGWLVAAGVIYFNINGFGDVFMHSSQRWTAVFILALSFGSTFAFASVATAVWLLPSRKDDFDRIR